MLETKDIVIPEIQIDSNFDKDEIFQIYVLWKSIPYLVKNPPQQKNGVQPSAVEFAKQMGIDDEELLKLVDIKDGKTFSEIYNVHQTTLVRWGKYIKERGYDDLADMRRWAKGLSNNLLMSLYNHAMKKGNPLTIKLWFQLVNQWEEKAQVEHKFTPINDIEHDVIDTEKKTQVDENKETAGGI